MGARLRGGVRKSKEKRHEPLVEFAFSLCVRGSSTAWVPERKAFYRKNVFRLTLHRRAALALTPKKNEMESETVGGSTDLMAK